MKSTTISSIIFVSFHSKNAKNPRFSANLGPKIHFLQVIVSFAFFRALQFIVRWYLFGKWTWPNFNFFDIRNRIRRRRRGGQEAENTENPPENEAEAGEQVEQEPEPDSRDLSVRIQKFTAKKIQKLGSLS